MKIKAFELHSVEGKNALDWVATGEVLVTTGMWWWKKTVKRMVRNEYGSSWHFVDNGEWTEGRQVEALVRSWEAHNGKVFREKS